MAALGGSHTEDQLHFVSEDSVLHHCIEAPHDLVDMVQACIVAYCVYSLHWEAALHARLVNQLLGDK